MASLEQGQDVERVVSEGERIMLLLSHLRENEADTAAQLGAFSREALRNTLIRDTIETKGFLTSRGPDRLRDEARLLRLCLRVLPDEADRAACLHAVERALTNILHDRRRAMHIAHEEGEGSLPEFQDPRLLLLVQALPREVFCAAIKETACTFLKTDSHDLDMLMGALPSIPGSVDITNDEEVRAAAETFLEKGIQKYDPTAGFARAVWEIGRVASFFHVVPDVSQDMVWQRRIKSFLTKVLQVTFEPLEVIETVLREFHVPQTLRQEPEVQEAAEQAIYWQAVNQDEADFTVAYKIAALMVVPADRVAHALKTGLMDVLNGSVSRASQENNDDDDDDNWGPVHGVDDQEIIPVAKMKEAVASKLFSWAEILPLIKTRIERALQSKDKAKVASVFMLAEQLPLRDFLMQAFNRFVNSRSWSLLRCFDEAGGEWSDQYHSFVRGLKERAVATSSSGSRRSFTEVLGGLAAAGDRKLLEELMAPLRELERAIADAPQGFAGISEGATIAIEALSSVSIPESNGMLFQLLPYPGTPLPLKFKIMSHLTSKYTHFEEVPWGYSTLRPWMEGQAPDDIRWEDLNFLLALRRIPSAEVRHQAQKLAESAFHTEFGLEASEEGARSTKNLTKEWRSACPSIPPEAFLQVRLLVAEDPVLLAKFEELYRSLRKEGTRKDQLLSAIVRCLTVPQNLRQVLTARLQELPFGKREDAGPLTDLFSAVACLPCLQGSPYEEDDEFRGTRRQRFSAPEELHQDIVEILERPATSLVELCRAVKSGVGERVQRILPHPELTGDRFMKILEYWGGDLEPVFTYRARYPESRAYIAQILVHTDTKERWQAWRYDKSELSVRRQIGYLTGDQLEIWKQTQAAELGEIDISGDDQEKPLAVRRLLSDAFVRDRHADTEAHQLIQVELGRVYAEAETQPELADAVFGKAIHVIEQRVHHLADFTKTCRDLIALRKLARSLPKWQSEERIKQQKRVELALDGDDVVGLLKKLKGVLEGRESNIVAYQKSLTTLRQSWAVRRKAEIDPVANRALQAQQREEEVILAREVLGPHAEMILDAWKRSNQLSALVPNPLSEETEEILLRYDLGADASVEDLEMIGARLEAKIVEERPGIARLVGVESAALGEQHAKALFQAQRANKAMLDLLRLSTLTPARIAANRISDKTETGGKGETITAVLENVKTYFGDTPLLQDLKNIESLLARRVEHSEKWRLAVLCSDDPRLLWQVGKYPLGSGSCQHYADGSMAGALLGYVGDSHTKVEYIINVNALPQEYQEAIEATSFAEVVESIPPKLLLQASIARAMVKLPKARDGRPVVSIAPTYGQAQNVSSHFTLFSRLLLSTPMNAHLAKGRGSEVVMMPSSRSMSGQYEDGSDGNERNAGMGIQVGSYELSTTFLDHERVMNQQDEAIEARIRMSA